MDICSCPRKALAKGWFDGGQASLFPLSTSIFASVVLSSVPQFIWLVFGNIWDNYCLKHYFLTCYSLQWICRLPQSYLLYCCCLRFCFGSLRLAERKKTYQPMNFKSHGKPFPEVVKIVSYTRLWKDQFCFFCNVQCIRKKVCLDSLVFRLLLITAKLLNYNRFVIRPCASAPSVVSCDVKLWSAMQILPEWRMSKACQTWRLFLGLRY